MGLLHRSNNKEDALQAIPRWSDDTADRPRVLLEHPDPWARSVVTRELEAHGYAVASCPGPGPDDDGEIACPVLRQEPCPAVAGADVVVSGLHLNRQVNRLILHRITRSDPTRPVVVECTAHMADRYGGDISHRIFPMEIDSLLATLDDLLV